MKSSVNSPERSEVTPAVQQMPHPLSLTLLHQPRPARSCFLKCGTGNLSRSTCSSLPHSQLFRVFSISYFVRLLTLCCSNVLGKNPTLTPWRGRVSLSTGWWMCYSTLMPDQLMSHWIPEGEKWSGVSFPLKRGRLTCLRISLTWEIRWGSSSMRDQI